MRSITSNSELKVLMDKLEKRLYKLIEEEKEIKNLKKELKEQKQSYLNKLEELEVKKNNIIEQANKDAQEHLINITEEATIILEELKELQNKGSIKLHEITAVKHELNELQDKHIPIVEKPKPIKRDIRLGDDVYVRKYDQYGNVMKVLKNGSFEVSLGNVSMVLKKDQLEVIDKIPDSKQPKVKIEKTKIISSAKMSLSLDLRGERYEDAKDKLQKYFDDAILTGLKQFTIIHGYGTGTIRNLVQDYLRKNKNYN